MVNVLDDVYNPGLREAIKTYSAWPTIPQARVWVGGEKVGPQPLLGAGGWGIRQGLLLACRVCCLPSDRLNGAAEQAAACGAAVSALQPQRPASLQPRVPTNSNAHGPPQVYVAGEFVGGADIVEAMYNSGACLLAC